MNKGIELEKLRELTYRLDINKNIDAKEGVKNTVSYIENELDNLQKTYNGTMDPEAKKLIIKALALLKEVKLLCRKNSKIVAGQNIEN